MKYFYNLLDGFKEPDRFYDEQTIRRFRVYPATPEIEKEAYENPHSSLWPGFPMCSLGVAFMGPFPNITGKAGSSMWMWLPITRL